MAKTLLKNICTGCGACFNICPKSAIKIVRDEQGFYKPQIDDEKCVNCGLCERICPIDKYKSHNIQEPKVFSLQNNDKETLYKCASGGAFALLAKYVIEQCGVVYGVIYDENMQVCHSGVTAIDELEKMYSSKYVQSNTLSTFSEAKNFLDDGKIVLYSGTPCQIAGLKSFLSKDYENLITVDLVCHGVPSPLIFEKYKQEFLKNKLVDEKILNIDFRSKINGWDLYNIQIETNKSVFTQPAKNNEYIKLFLQDLSINKSCTECQFNKLPRVSDLSLGDFWGVDEYDKSLNNNKGLSIILINSEKGKKICEKIKKFATCTEISLDVVKKYNKNIYTTSKVNPKQTDFWIDILQNNKTLKSCANKYAKTPLHIAVYRLLPKTLKEIIKNKFLTRK